MDRQPSVLSRFTHLCLCLLTDEHMRETILEDMEERYAWDRENKGPFRAGLSWLSSLLVILATFTLKSIIWRFVMFKNYLRTALRNIKRQPGFSFINISGFATLSLYCENITFYDFYKWSSILKSHNFVKKLFFFIFYT